MLIIKFFNLSRLWFQSAWLRVPQRCIIARNRRDWDDEEVINFEAKSECIETSRDFKKMEFFNSKGKWQLVPKEVEHWYHKAEEKAMDGK